jgi:Leucine-rich repeat (LRR) protein
MEVDSNQSTELVESEYSVIKELEKALAGKPIPKLTNIDDVTLGYVVSGNHISHLKIINQELSSLPESICNLINLQYLSLDKNQLSSIPDIIGNLTNLQFLSLSGNQLSSIPDIIGNLTNLQNSISVETNCHQFLIS